MQILDATKTVIVNAAAAKLELGAGSYTDHVQAALDDYVVQNPTATSEEIKAIILQLLALGFRA